MMRRKPAPHARVNRKVTQLRTHRGGAPRAAAGRPVDHAEHRARRQDGAVRDPVGQDRPCPWVHPDLPTAITLPVPNKQAATALVEVGLCEREGLVYPNACAPQHNDQTRIRRP